MVMSPVPNYPSTAPTSPLLLPPQHLFQPSSLTMMHQSGMMPTNRLVTSSAMMQPSGMMAQSTMVTPAVMSPVASLQNMISPEQGPSLIGSSSPLLYQGL